MVSRLAPPVAAGLLAALLFLSLALKPGSLMFGILGTLSPLPLMVVALSLGQIGAALAIAVGAVAVVAVTGSALVTFFLVMAGLPVLVVANRALLWRQDSAGTVEWYPAGRVVGWLVVLVLAVLALVTLIGMGHPGGLQGWIGQSVNHTLTVIGGNLPEAERQKMAGMLTRILPAVLMLMWLVTTAINAAFAQVTLVRFGHARRPSPTLAELNPPDWLAALLVVVLAAWGLGGGTVAYLASNLVAVALFPFALLGVATAHHAIAGRPGAAMGLVALYAIMFLALAWALALAAILGLVMFVKMRAAHYRPGGGKEN